jgi:hypothetical protein
MTEEILTSKMADILLENGYFMARYKGERGLCGVRRFMFTSAIVYGITEEGYTGRWCYETLSEATDEFQKWDGIGDPGGDWIKHKGLTEYKNPNL